MMDGRMVDGRLKKIYHGMVEGTRKCGGETRCVNR